jgi:alkylhydroperoxidase family enzyme
MRRNLILAGLALLLAGCTIGEPRSPAAMVFDIRAAYDTGVLAPAVAYASLPRCPAVPACADPSVVVVIRKADAAALSALDGAEKTVRDHPDLDAAAAIDAARNAVKAAQQILAIYGVH